MNPRHLGWTCTCLLVVFAWEASAVERVERYDDGAGGQMWYRLYLPDNFDPNRSYPLTTFLHGSDGMNIRPVVIPENDVGRPPPNLVNALAGAPYESILVAPQLERGSWTSSQNDRLVREAIDSVQATFQTDRQRRYLTGLSFGSFGTFGLIGEFPDYFAAAAPIAGGYFPPFDPFDPFPLEPFREYVETVKDVPIWAFHGAQDIVVDVETTRGVVAALEAGGANVRYSELPRGAHDIWDQIYDKDGFPATAVFRLEVDTQAQTFQVFASVDPTRSLGLHRYSVNLVGAESVRNIAPKSDFSPATGTAVGFYRGRTGDDQFPLTGLQNNDFADGSVIEGFAQVAGTLPGAGTGDGEVQPEYAAPLLIAEGTYTDLAALDFSAELDARNFRSANASVIPLNRSQRIPFAVAYAELVHDGQVIYRRGDHQDLYTWLFKQRLVPEPGTATLLAICAIGLLQRARFAPRGRDETRVNIGG